jgi:hypothetical protein
MKRHNTTMILILFLLASPLLAVETRFKVKHDHGFKSCQGELVFGDTTVEYMTDHKKDVRVWKYLDIQQLGLLTPKRIALLSYEDRKLEFGKDKIFNFELIEGTISESLWVDLKGKLARPLVSEIIPTDVKARYTIPVKHRHAFGGCQGTLEIGDQYAIYRTTAKAHSRIWKYSDLSSVGSTGPFQLRITMLERVNGEYGADRNFIFDLKSRLDQAAYDFIWWKLNGPQIATDSIAGQTEQSGEYDLQSQE